MTETIERSRFYHELRVRFADTDAQGHVFFANYLTFFDEAFTYYFRAIGFPYGSMEESGVDIVYKQSSCEHLGRSFFSDALQIDARMQRVGNTSLTVAFAAFRDEGQELVARGELTCVVVDRKSMTKMRVPEALRKAVAAFEPRPVEGL